jgi:sulfatase maturation enzyme AslB (radical SAM superfamily)
MSDYNQSADIAEKQLKNISKTMCYAKWTQVSMHLTNGKTHSCYHPPLHDMDVDAVKANPKALHNTAQKKEERAMMLKGERPAGCAYCWKIEDVGGRSDRIYRSGEYWAQNSRSDIIDALDTGDVDPRYMEVNFNQACNFSCMYCSPHLSTTWEEKIKEHGEFKILDVEGKETGHNNLEYLQEKGLMPLKVRQSENPYLEAFWKWWPSLYNKLEVFRITGGEPLMDINTFRVLEYIYENPNTWLELSITTNMCPPKEELMDRFLSKVKKLEEIQIWEDKNRWNPGSGNNWYVNMALKNFALFISVDSVGSQAEYIRGGLKWDTMTRNTMRFLTETKNTTVTFINTFNALSVPKVKDYLEYVLKLRQRFSASNQGVQYIPIHDPYTKHDDYEIHPRQRIWFDIPLIRYPDWQTIQILTPDFDKYLEEAIDFMKQNSDVSDFAGFYDFEIAKLERNLAIMRERVDIDRNKIELDRKNFARFFDQYDERNFLKFVEVFPEMEDFYKLCKTL